MNNGNKKNIIWVVTDSARNFSTGGLDDRDKPEYYDSVLDDFVSFNHAVTSAPSSVMSGSTMLTGLNSYLIGRNYDDFRYEKGLFHNLPEILKESGYFTTSIFVAREMRDKIAPFIGMMDRKYWPDHLRHAQKMWSNEDANVVFKNFLTDYDKQKPLFLMLWNNIRHDDRISENLKDMENTLRETGFYDDSVIIYCADHGYPHPRRGFTPEGMKRQGLTHDLMLSDDNIQIPFLIKAPDIKPRVLDQMVGTIDLFPTVLDYAGVNLGEGNQLKPSGLSLRGLLEGKPSPEFENRCMRCDCRFFGQPDRRTGIRSSTHKYVYYHDTGKEEFFDLLSDPGEDNDAFETMRDTQAFSELKSIFLAEEKIANDFQVGYASRKLVEKIAGIQASNGLIVFSLFEESLNNVLVKAISTGGLSKINAFIGAVSSDSDIDSTWLSFRDLNAEDIQKLQDMKQRGAKVIDLYVAKDRDHEDLHHFLSSEKFDTQLSLDINFSENKEIQWNIARIWKALVSRKQQIIEEPSVLLTYGRQLFRVLFGKRIKSWSGR